jgi:hypothetical protein
MGTRQALTAPLNIQQLLAAKQMGLGDYIAQAEMKSRTPSLRERIGNLIYDAAQGAGLRQSAQSMRSNAETAVDFVPVLGDAIGAQEAGRDLGAGNYLSGGLGLAATLVPGAIAEKAVKKGIKGFHGSPHDFDRFDSSKIGTGEGAQAYGHGLYIAESEGVAKAYRDNLSAPKIDGVPVAEISGARAKSADDAFLASILAHEKTLDGARFRLNRLDRLDLMERLDELVAAGRIEPGGKMYEVNINADPDDFLDWDKPIDANSPQSIRDALNKVANSRPEIKDKLRQQVGQPGAMFYSVLNDAARTGDLVKNQTAATEALKQAGVPGIKYLDRGSRAAGDGSRNYVVFDDRLIDIVRKYGIPAAIGAGFITQEMAAQMQAQGEI